MIDVAFTPDELDSIALGEVTAVVIDVVRASTTIATALASGAVAVVPVATPEEARRRLRDWRAGQVLLGGERGGVQPPGFDCGNSPAEYTEGRVRGRTVLFTTTNGTRALLAVVRARRAAVGGFTNAAAVVRWLDTEPGDVVFVCAGEAGRFCLEDAVGAGLLVSRLGARWPSAPWSDAARAAVAVHAHYADDPGQLLAHASWARALAAQGRGGDLPLCVAVDAHQVVPVVQGGQVVAFWPAESFEPAGGGKALTAPPAHHHNEGGPRPRGGGDA